MYKSIRPHHTFIANAQESQAAARNILDFIAPKGNAKTHIDVMKDMLKSEQKTEEQVREKERRRRESLERRHKLRE
ncbi:hypothetical protein TUM19329_00970 [Legionella antarctica]|uniref:Uncharacterized protein n=1 Tax=Legionella antarctica TaxID=2708020 RepID=A0A6F8T166_9GAMM|nr:hypothetical protein TUM19329_00970 [Legionella antarctica]